MKKYLLLLIMKPTGKEFKRELRTIESISEGEIDLKDFVENSLRKVSLYNILSPPMISTLNITVANLLS